MTATNPIELHLGRDGVDISPLQLFPSDLYGPVNVAQRIADTFGRVYKRIGVQQHAIVRQAVLDVMADAGIRADSPQGWSADLPAFGEVQLKLNDLDAAAKILSETAEPMTGQEMIAQMAAKGYWQSPRGRTPGASLYSANSREIVAKGKEARFVKSERGRFARNGAA